MFQNFKTFQVYSSFHKEIKKLKEVVEFQNFSSLQFILLTSYALKTLTLISKLFKFTVHGSGCLLLGLLAVYFKTFQVYSSFIPYYNKEFKYDISKLFKFTVHEVKIE